MPAQLNRYLDLYKHHFDLFLKAVFLYLAATAAIAGFMNREGADRYTKAELSLLISLTSAFAVAGCWMARQWVRLIKGKADRVCNELDVDTFPFQSAERITELILIASALILIGGLYYAHRLYHGR